MERAGRQLRTRTAARTRRHGLGVARASRRWALRRPRGDQVPRSRAGGCAGVERFRQEGEVLARLDHANIARLIDAGVTDHGQPYLVLEYVEGEALDRWCVSRSLDIARARAAVPRSSRCRRARAQQAGPASRPEASEHPRHARRAREAARLRHREDPRHQRCCAGRAHSCRCQPSRSTMRRPSKCRVVK